MEIYEGKKYIYPYLIINILFIRKINNNNIVILFFGILFSRVSFLENSLVVNKTRFTSLSPQMASLIANKIYMFFSLGFKYIC